MNQLVLSGTATLVPSGTGSSCYRGPKSGLRPCCATFCSARNFPNLKSFGFFLTDPAFVVAGDNQQKLRASTVRVSFPSPIQNQSIGKTWLRQQVRSAQGRAAMALPSVTHPHRLSDLIPRDRCLRSLKHGRRASSPSTCNLFIFSNMEEAHERSHAGRDSVA
ncbi:MAG: hypothetical protein JWQ16_913 [Novosphingobium sp.]|nr:hypothetical protein [Novosphingobium sp.]